MAPRQTAFRQGLWAIARRALQVPLSPSHRREVAALCVRCSGALHLHDGRRIQADLGAQHPAGCAAPLFDHVPHDEAAHRRPVKSAQVPASTSFGRAGSFQAIRSPTKITPVTSVLSGSPNMPRLATKSPTAVPAARTMTTV